MTKLTRASVAQPTEHQIQVAVCNYLDAQYPEILFLSIPNGAMLGGGKIGAIRMRTLKEEGLCPGASDLLIFEPRGGYACMFMELKRDDGGNGASVNQMDFLREVEKRGAFGVVCNGFEEARAVLDDYLTGNIKSVPNE